MELQIGEGSQISQKSVDSSQILSVSQSFDQTQSLKSLPDHSENKEDKKMIGNIYQSPKQLPRLNQQNRYSQNFYNFQQPFIGFFQMGKGKAIQINESKIKRAKKLMEDQQNQFVFDSPKFGTAPAFKEQNSCSTRSLDSKTIENQLSSSSIKSDKIQQYPDFSIGFKSLGTGAIIKISEETTNRVKQMFKEFQVSDRKETKSKNLNSDFIRASSKFTNFTKTQKMKPTGQRQIKIAKKQAAVEIGRNIIEIMLTKLHKFQTKPMRLQDLCNVTVNDNKRFEEYWLKFLNVQIEHSNSDCQIRWCYFCQKYKDRKILINRQFLIEQIEKLIKLSEIERKKVENLFTLVVFKLCRYQFFEPTLVNKRLNCSNLLLELYKKCLSIQKQQIGPLEQSLSTLVSSRGKICGRQLILVITNISFSEQRNSYFLQLSDGWIRVYALISMSNELYPFVNTKIVIGSKMEIVNWSIHPVCNILECHPDPLVRNSDCFCIQISYNGSRPVGFWSKLGCVKQPFYRSVEKCKQTGGGIPLVEGIILRMFSIKNNKINSNYVQILLAQGNCIIMKVCLAEQVSLVQLFRLYYCYHFCRVKKISNSLLQFTGTSKYYEVEDKERINKVTETLRVRLLNLIQPKQGVEKMLKEGNKCEFDLITKSQIVEFGEMKLRVEEKIDGTVLLQQYRVAKQGEEYTVSKGERGSCLRRIPKIYENISYQSY